MTDRTRLRSFAGAVLVVLVCATAFAQYFDSIGRKLRADDLAQLGRAANGMLNYASDHDGLLPLQSGQDSVGAWQYQLFQYVPADWPVGPGGDSQYAHRIVSSPSCWANSILPYLGGTPIYRSSGVPVIEVAASSAQRGGPHEPAPVSYTFPGTLTQYPVSAVVSPGKFPLLWQGVGRGAADGAGYTNPALKCDQPSLPCTYQPSGASCAPGNGGTSFGRTLIATAWIYDKTADWLTVDGSATFRPLGAKITPDGTDFNVDPYTGYDANGLPSTYWQDGCHPWLFRPDASY